MIITINKSRNKNTIKFRAEILDHEFYSALMSFEYNERKTIEHSLENKNTSDILVAFSLVVCRIEENRAMAGQKEIKNLLSKET